MKKQFLLFTMLVMAFLSASAQKPDTAQVLVHYKFTHVRDTTNKANPYTENMVLIVGKNAAAYKSYDAQMENELFKKQFQEKLANSPDGHVSMNRSSHASGTAYYQYPDDKKLVRKEPLAINSYLVTSDLPAIDWKIRGDTATFGGLHCQKATAHFMGRDYTAWFCPDLPLHVGPWKLNGLPGVIVEAYDEKKDVVFKFDGIEKAVIAVKTDGHPAGPVHDGQGPITLTVGMDDSDADPNIILPPAKAIKTSEKEFSKLQEAMRKDPDALVQSMLAAQAANMPGGGPKMNMKIKVGPQPVINNPIELPEKK